MDPARDIDALVEVGRRAPGSDAERRAAVYVEDRLNALGRSVETQALDAYPAWAVSYTVLAAVAVGGSVLSVSVPAPGAALALAAALLTFLDAGLLLPTLRRLLGRRASQNVLSRGGADKPGALVLVAHTDAPHGGLALGERVRVAPLFWAELAVLACCLLRLSGVTGTAFTAVQFVPTVALLVQIALLIDLALAPTRGGENDNASGVALALRLAERLDGLEHFDLQLLFTGAQTARAAGMRAFLKGDVESERTVLLNLDEVGSGTVRYTTREGPLVTTRSHPQLVALCDEIAEDDAEHAAFGARPLTNREASDGHAASAAGFAAITISCRDRIGHAPARVDQTALERAEAFCVELVGRVDATIGPDLAGTAPVSRAEPP